MRRKDAIDYEMGSDDMPEDLLRPAWCEKCRLNCLSRISGRGFMAFSEWKPIDSAPKDGTEYLAINDNGAYSVCNWNTMEWANSEPCVFPMSDATHWMPLPLPPARGSND